jgi:hypothetical protein
VPLMDRVLLAALAGAVESRAPTAHSRETPMTLRAEIECVIKTTSSCRKTAQGGYEPCDDGAVAPAGNPAIS